MELLLQKATKVIKEEGACGVQKECEGTRFVHPGKGWIQGGYSYTFCHCFNKKDEEKMHTFLRSTRRKKEMKETVRM